MKIELSVKKQRFIDFIREHIEQYGHAPSFEELMLGLGFKSLGTVNWYVKSLEEDGVLKRSRGPNGKRALQLIEENEMTSILPLAGTIAAGYPLEAIEVPESIEVPLSYVRKDNYVLRVKGDSMIDDNIQDGDYVIIHKKEVVAPGSIIVAYVNEEATLKRYYPKTDHIELHPRNPEFNIINVFPDDTFRIGGELLYVFRKYD
ncbi:repressor LexA [bacterium]|nr:repressor LexA [bacterium]